MAKFVVEFSPPVKLNNQDIENNELVANCIILAPFQKQAQVEFKNIKLKETAVRYLTIVNPLDKPRQFTLPPPSDGIYFDVYDFSLEPNSQRLLTITWQPAEYGNIRKLVKIEQKDSNKKYDFVVLGSCNFPPHKRSKVLNSKTSNVSKKLKNCGQKNNDINKTRLINTDLDHAPLIKTALQVRRSNEQDVIQSPLRRQTYLVGEKENYPVTKRNICRDTLLISPERSMKRPDQQRQDHYFNSHFNLHNKSSSPMSDDSLEKPIKLIPTHSPFNDFCLTPLKNSENLLSPFSTTRKSHSFEEQQLSFDIPDGASASTSLNSLLGFKPIETSTVSKVYTPEEKKPNRVSVNLLNIYEKTSEDGESNKASTTYIKEDVSTELNSSPTLSNKINSSQCTTFYNSHYRSMITCSGSKPKRPSFVIKNSPYYKCSPKASAISKSKLKQYSISPLRSSRMRAPKLDKCDQYLKCIANPDLVYHNNADDPFLKMSQYYESEWLNRQESDMIRWLNALLTPTDKLVDEEHSGDLEQAAMAWVEASKESHKNKPMQFATQKDLFVAQIYRQSPQQWSALRKATTNLITSQSVATVLSKLSISIEKDLITVRDDRQIHLDLSLKKKITDMLKCYNPIWFRIGLEAVYGQIVPVRVGSTDLDGVGWFIRKNLFNNDYVKQKFTKSTVLQVNLPSFNVAMKKFILRKILMLIYFLDRAKEQQLIRHNPCLFKVDSPYKSSYDFLMGFCADMVTAHGDITRRLRSIGYNLTHKQTHLDEVNYAVKSLNDLRDGTRITRVVEILFKGNPLSQKLRLPAISKLQKIHNVNLAMERISDHITIEGNINTRDIVNGHREKMLSLFWQIIYKYLTPKYNNAAAKIQNWWRNSSLKLVVLKRIRAKRIAKRNVAATKIQAHVRGFLLRKEWPLMKTELMKNREKLHVASTKIKHYLQKKLKLLTEERKRFIILRKTIVYVQRKFRANAAMKLQKQKFLNLKTSSLTIQKWFRGYLVRKNWSVIKINLESEKTNRINAINIVVCALRKNLTPTQDRLNFLKLKQTTIYIQQLFIANKMMKIEMKRYTNLKLATIFIQRKFRANIAMRQHRHAYLKTRSSTLLIQKVFRGFVLRKNWPMLKTILQTEKEKRISSANLIKRVLRKQLPQTQERLDFLKLQTTVIFVQRLYRANKMMQKQKIEFNSLKRATIFIQRKFRANIAMRRDRCTYLNTVTSTLFIQKVFRGFMLRKNWPMLKNILQTEKEKRIHSSNIIKRILRKQLPQTQERLDFIKLQTTVIFVQRLYRANKMMQKQMIEFNSLKRATIFIQRKFRANIAMRRDRCTYLNTVTSTLFIQKVFRGFMLRKNWPMLKTILQTEKEKRIHSSNIIKRILRKQLPQTQERLDFIKLQTTVIFVQRLYRANKMMQKQKIEFNSLKRAIIFIQRKFRANIAMRRDRCTYLNTVTSTLFIQKVFRGFMLRKNWPMLKTILQTEKEKRIHSSNIIKRILRKQLPQTQERLDFLKLQTTVIFVQRMYRANKMMQKQMIEFNSLKRATIFIQRKFRANIAMRRDRCTYLNTVTSTLLIQKVFRGFMLRKNWPMLKTILQTEKEKRINSANLIKRVLRKQLPQTQERLDFLKLQTTVIFVQRFYRSNKMMQKQMNKFNTFKRATLLVQRKFRANIAMKRDREAYLNALNEKKNIAASKIQAAVRGFLIRKKLPQLITDINTQKQNYAATLIQSVWRGYQIRKRYVCRRETIRFPKQRGLTLGRRHNDVEDVLRRQKKNEYSYKELAAVFWTLELCTSLSKELCKKTAEGTIVDYIFHFLQYSNQSQPSVEAREPAIRVLINLLRYHETSWYIWRRTVNADMVKDLIKIMKTSCGKIGANKLYCSISTWLWIVLQDPEKKRIIQNITVVAIDLKFMLDTLNRKYKTRKVDKKMMALPSTRPTWNIGSKCQKCFESDLYATTQLCKLLNIK
ncbi:protein abnormal spindle isoform X3 [Adelges cooleyi]|uniref:protein abnormal spindle isoform X3 n=1 Tax=Adelges cooleyi TaxID=133065 RepID=UPI00218036D0|nr:protein abnormal spindle isoform X3 [Adelges cooleyi]